MHIGELLMKILLVDDESDIRDIVSFYLEEHFRTKIEIKMADGAPAAIEMLNGETFDLVVSDHDMPKGEGSLIHKHVETKKINCKYVVCSSVNPLDRKDVYECDKLFFNILKPNIEMGIISLAKKFDLPKDFFENDGFMPIGINLLYLMRIVPCDMYVALSKDKYLKCFHKGDSFTNDDKEKYSGREIYSLYAKIDENQNEVFNSVKTTIESILKNKSKNIEHKMLDTHHQVTHLLKSYGFSETSIELAKSTIDQTAKLMMKSDDSISKAWLRMNLLGEYPSKLFVLQSTLCGIVAQKLSWSSENTLQKIVTATFFQDLNLDSLHLIKLIDYNDFLLKRDEYSDKECENYLNHPLKAKEMLTKIKDLPPDIDKIILEQHELPNGEGFPRKLNAQQISPLSAMLILTGVISKTMLNSKKEDINFNDFFNELLEQGYNKGHYKYIYNHTKAFFTN